MVVVAGTSSPAFRPIVAQHAPTNSGFLWMNFPALGKRWWRLRAVEDVTAENDRNCRLSRAHQQGVQARRRGSLFTVMVGMYVGCLGRGGLDHERLSGREARINDMRAIEHVFRSINQVTASFRGCCHSFAFREKTYHSTQDFIYQLQEGWWIILECYWGFVTVAKGNLTHLEQQTESDKRGWWAQWSTHLQQIDNFVVINITVYDLFTV